MVLNVPLVPRHRAVPRAGPLIQVCTQAPFGRRLLPGLKEDYRGDDPSDESQDAKDFPGSSFHALSFRFAGGDKGKRPESDAKYKYPYHPKDYGVAPVFQTNGLMILR
jgi:hypothetical protein